MITGLDEYEKNLTSGFGMIQKQLDYSTKYLFTKQGEDGATELFKYGDESQVWITDVLVSQMINLEYSYGEDEYIGISYIEQEASTTLHSADSDCALDTAPRLSYPTDKITTGSLLPGAKASAVNLFLHASFFNNHLPKLNAAFDVLKIIRDIDEKTFFQHLNPILVQMLHSPFTGASQYLFLQGKVLEVSAQLMQLLYENRSDNKVTLTDDDKKQLGTIPDILSAQIASPPSIPELARLLAMNEFKLKAGFKQMYGTTIYEYLRKLRIERALLLLSKGTPLQQTAELLGYKSLRGFSDSFQKYCGMTPANWLKASCNTVIP